MARKHLSVWSQELYDKAYRFAAQAHLGQKIPGSEIPYLMHLSLVSMEVMTALCLDGLKKQADLAVSCALLHDVIEDTSTTHSDVENEFGSEIASGVLALTKNTKLPNKWEQMEDSLQRITEQPQEIWMVKLADRICNLAPPPFYWDDPKKRNYQQEARLIHNKLHSASPTLATRLLLKIDQYAGYFDVT